MIHFDLQVGGTRFSIFHLTFFICHLKTGSPALGRSLCPVMTNEKWKMENGKSSPPSQPANYRSGLSTSQQLTNFSPCNELDVVLLKKLAEGITRNKLKVALTPF